jgi:hypothetical protein
MQNMNSLLKFTIVFLIPLVPALVLYNSLEIKDTNQFVQFGIKLGGASAGYVIFLIFANNIFYRIDKTEKSIENIAKNIRNGEIFRKIKMREDYLSQFVGEWTYEEDVFQSGNKIQYIGTASIQVTESLEVIANGIGMLKANKTPVYRWVATSVIIKEQVIQILYSVDPLNQDGGTWRGVMDLNLNLDSDGQVRDMVGGFDTLLQDRSGTLTFKHARRNLVATPAIPTSTVH